jgi:hypothetical protein
LGGAVARAQTQCSGNPTDQLGSNPAGKKSTSHQRIGTAQDTH